MNRATGTIALVQEERFLLAGDDGTKRLFVLAANAPLEAAALHAFERAGAHVEVQYDDPKALLIHTAHQVRPCKEFHELRR